MPSRNPQHYQQTGRTRHLSLGGLQIALTNQLTRSPKLRRLEWAHAVLDDHRDYPGVMPSALVQAARDALAEITGYTRSAALLRSA
jgi:hypothetical protein